jgi:hypothetical protein
LAAAGLGTVRVASKVVVGSVGRVCNGVGRLGNVIVRVGDAVGDRVEPFFHQKKLQLMPSLT